MTSTPSFLQRTPRTSISSQDWRAAMGRMCKTPSPAPDAHFLNAESILLTPKGPCPTPFGLESPFQDRDDTSLRVAALSDTTDPYPQTPKTKSIKAYCYEFSSLQTPICSNGVATQHTTAHTSKAHHMHSNERIDAFWVDELRPSVSPITPCSSLDTIFSKIVDPPRPDSITSFVSIESDGSAAVQPSSIMSTRRSTRIKNKLNKQGGDNAKPNAKPVKTVTGVKPVSRNLAQDPQSPSQPILTQAESTTSPFEIAISSNTELPIHGCTEWQLKYPLGGSTHPCYPWPMADPRLIFHSCHVPLSQGLPDVSYAPRLVLPAGWRQACWSGLHPVVFDPYQQAFKLTPVGPLPLTSEELHQGGLQDYIPGGKCHPEFGLIPLLSMLGDGSDSEVFNFEGVDWKLPWAQVKGDSEYETPTTSVSLTRDDVSSILSLSLNSDVPRMPHYIEGRDCPDDVVDLEDAWRWLQEWDPSSTTEFHTSPGKSWRGTGIPLSARTIKQPTASLMAMSMAEKDSNIERYLVKQVRKEFCAFKSVATPVHVDISLLKDVEFTIVELLAYFPSHYQWRGAAKRLTRSGMTSSDVANFVNMVRHLPAESLCKSGTVNTYLHWDRDEEGNRVRVKHSADDLISYTAEHWSNNVWETTDYPLLGLAVGLKNLPIGPDAGPITFLIKWCREHNRYRAMLSEGVTLLMEAGINPLIEPGNGSDPDQEVVIRHSEAMKKDRLRVLKELRASKGKRKADVTNDRTSKRRKME